MIWEQRVKVIVQLNAEDGGYIFDSIVGRNAVRHGNITQQRVSFRGHTLTHYHYTAWPDLGVPENNSEVLGLVRMVGGSMTPMIVHCKGGVGRTGTFVAIHAAAQMAKLGLTPHMASIVEALKRARSMSVETREQYVFAHTAVLEKSDDDL